MATIRLADIERMLAEHLQTREHLVTLVRDQIASRERDLPMLRGILQSLEACGVGEVDGG